jgi:hypothetical protein
MVATFFALVSLHSFIGLVALFALVSLHFKQDVGKRIRAMARHWKGVVENEQKGEKGGKAKKGSEQKYFGSKEEILEWEAKQLEDLEDAEDGLRIEGLKLMVRFLGMLTMCFSQDFKLPSETMSVRLRFSNKYLTRGHRLDPASLPTTVHIRAQGWHGLEDRTERQGMVMRLITWMRCQPSRMIKTEKNKVAAAEYKKCNGTFTARAPLSDDANEDEVALSSAQQVDRKGLGHIEFHITLERNSKYYGNIARVICWLTVSPLLFISFFFFSFQIYKLTSRTHKNTQNKLNK